MSGGERAGLAGQIIGWLREDPAPRTALVGGRELPVAIRRHPRARRLTMRLAPDGSEIRVTLPRWGRSLDAMIFVASRADWLEAQLAAIPEATPLAAGGTLRYRGRELAIDWAATRPRKPVLGDASIVLGGPHETVPSRLQRWCEAEALRMLGDDLAHYCARAGRAAPQLRLSRAQRRWGSCSGRSDGARCIRINWRLVQAPDAVRRSVVAHEVAHLVHFDHSPAFHALLGELYEGDLADADGWLRREGRGLYAAFG
ncbi:MAG: metal-dependent hydrolase [Sphingomonadales bacterium 32-68-7]|nr:MAG: metal-dependent hydrolase [Sphingomonadales bacterium 12-68-11]OYX08343.1 MAG: metal-dependent hydrolase [Sphingomonadales bacterium 32-68-7]